MKNLAKINLLAALLVAGTFPASAITFEFVPTSIEGGGAFSATVTFSDSDIDNNWKFQNPLAFSASLTGNTYWPGMSAAAWELDEIESSTYRITTGRELTFNALTARDTDTASPIHYLLGGGGLGFASPVTIRGSWKELVTSSEPVPETIPAALLPSLVVGLAFLARRVNSKRG